MHKDRMGFESPCLEYEPNSQFFTLWPIAFSQAREMMKVKTQNMTEKECIQLLHRDPNEQIWQKNLFFSNNKSTHNEISIKTSKPTQFTKTNLNSLKHKIHDNIKKLLKDINKIWVKAESCRICCKINQKQ